MAVIGVDIGERRIWLTAYNPADALSLLYCELALAIAREALDGMTAASARAWLEEHVPDTRELFALLDQGWELPREVPIGEFPVSPQDAAYELPIVTQLVREWRAQHGARAGR